MIDLLLIQIGSILQEFSSYLSAFRLISCAYVCIAYRSTYMWVLSCCI